MADMAADDWKGGWRHDCAVLRINPGNLMRHSDPHPVTLMTGRGHADRARISDAGETDDNSELSHVENLESLSRSIWH